MDQTPPASSEPPPPPTTTTTTTTTPPSTTTPEQQQQPQPPPPPQSQSQPPPPTTTTSSLQPLPVNPNPKLPNLPVTSQPLNLSRPQLNRPFPPFPHFSSIPQRPAAAGGGGMALGVPAPQPPSSLTNVVRQSVSGSFPQRPIHSSLRPQQITQNFQDPGMLRHSSAGSPALTTPQNTQPWLSSGTQGKPPLPPPSSFRPQLNPQTLQQRAHIPAQQQAALSVSAPQPQTSSSLSQDQHYTLPPSRVPQALVQQQQQMARNRGLGNQRPFAPAVGQSGPVSPQPTVNKPSSAVEPAEPCNRIISKRSIQEIVAQIDPSERLDPEVEDILVDIADDFVESVTTFACSLAKHRKSNTLESKDILLHLEKNWNMSLPGFSGDEIKCYKKPFGNDVHRERLAAIKKSIAAAEPPSLKSSGGQAAGGAKGHPAKTPGLVIGSPNPKGRETT